MKSNYAVLTLAFLIFSSSEAFSGSNAMSATRNRRPPEVTLTPVLVIGEGDDPRALLYHPNAVSVDLEGNIFVLDAGNRRVVKFDKQGRFIAEFGRKGQGPGEFRDPKSLAIHFQSNSVYVADTMNGRLERFDLAGRFVRSMSTRLLGNSFTTLAFDKHGHLEIWPKSPCRLDWYDI